MFLKLISFLSGSISNSFHQGTASLDDDTTSSIASILLLGVFSRNIDDMNLKMCILHELIRAVDLANPPSRNVLLSEAIVCTLSLNLEQIEDSQVQAALCSFLNIIWAASDMSLMKILSNLKHDNPLQGSTASCLESKMLTLSLFRSLQIALQNFSPKLPMTVLFEYTDMIINSFVSFICNAFLAIPGQVSISSLKYEVFQEIVTFQLQLISILIEKITSTSSALETVATSETAVKRLSWNQNLRLWLAILLCSTKFRIDWPEETRIGKEIYIIARCNVPLLIGESLMSSHSTDIIEEIFHNDRELGQILEQFNPDDLSWLSKSLGNNILRMRKVTDLYFFMIWFTESKRLKTGLDLRPTISYLFDNARWLSSSKK